jgi:hypothetical protein
LKVDSKQISKVLLVEVAGSHDECLYTQIKALEDENIDFLVAVDSKVAERLEVDPSRIRIVRSGADGSWKTGNQILKLIAEYHPDKVIFNTAQGSIVRNVALRSLFSSIEFLGIIHTNRKFQGSFTQKLINLKIKKYAFLAKFLHDKITAPKGIQTAWFYPLDFPFVSTDAKTRVQGKVAVIGGVEARRKDLDGFLRLISDDKTQGLTFTFLGKSDEKSEEVARFKRILREKGREEDVRLFDDFVSHRVFAEVMHDADFVLPLIHPNTPSAEQYFSNQIPGAMNAALAWKKPLLLHEDFSFLQELSTATFYYNFSSFGEVIRSIDDERYSSKVEEMNTLQEYSQVYNRKAFIRFLKNGNN